MTVERYPRRILLAVTGMSTQVVTETLWALFAKGELPTEVYLVTTEHGRNRAVRDLLDPKDGRFHAFCRDYGLEGRIAFSEDSIRVIQSASGDRLTDIRTPEDNASAADVILKVVRSFCADERAQVHVSIAGGRKTMGFFAGYALSLFGRAQDRLSHVLVSEPFESNRDFFYPSPVSRNILSTDGRLLDEAQARVTLAEIPFVRLREGLSANFPEDCTRYEDVVERAQAEMLPPVSLRIELREGADPVLLCSGRRVNLAPIPLAVYVWLAERRKCSAEGIRPGLEAAAEILALHAELFPRRSGDHARSLRALKHEEDVLPYFQEKPSLIHRALREALPERLAESYFVAARGRRPNTVYMLNIDPDVIDIVRIPDARSSEKR